MQFPGYYLWYGVVYKRQLYAYRQNTNIEKIYVYMRASLENFLAFLHSKTAISFNILLVLQILCRYKINDMLVGLHVATNFEMYRQNSEKALWGGGGGEIAPLPSPPPGLC